jgi:DNA-binding HxlR family transcriptional regulator
LEVLERPWTTYILWILCSQGAQRFGQLRRAVGGISAKVLTERLRLLEPRASSIATIGRRFRRR